MSIKYTFLDLRYDDLNPEALRENPINVNDHLFYSNISTLKFFALFDYYQRHLWNIVRNTFVVRAEDALDPSPEKELFLKTFGKDAFIVPFSIKDLKRILTSYSENTHKGLFIRDAQASLSQITNFISPNFFISNFQNCCIFHTLDILNYGEFIYVLKKWFPLKEIDQLDLLIMSCVFNKKYFTPISYQKDVEETFLLADATVQTYMPRTLLSKAKSPDQETEHISPVHTFLQQYDNHFYSNYFLFYNDFQNFVNVNEDQVISLDIRARMKESRILITDLVDKIDVLKSETKTLQYHDPFQWS